MSTSSEDVLLMVSEVKHKKTDGTIYLMSERIAWMPNGKDTFTISHNYSDIKMQKISPEGKPKIQLQVVLHNNEATTFHFVHSEGVERQLKDRNDIKEMLHQLLPKFKQKISKELEEKNRVLSSDPSLFQLYKDLVVSQILSAEEFWKQIAPIRCPSLSGVINLDSTNDNNRSNFLSRAVKQNYQQSIGISPAFLADIKPQHDGCNGIRYNITTDIIEAIFRTYPAVKRKHFDYVPHKMSDSEFWTRFFQSHYFHRDRVLAGSSSNKTDLFADCAKSDDLDLKNAAKNKVFDSFVNLEDFNDAEYIHKLPSDEKKDEKKEEPVKKKRERDKEVLVGPVLSANQALIKRFNHHSIMVLEASTVSENKNNENNDVSKIKKKKLIEKTEYEDLDEKCLNDCEEWFIDGSKNLEIGDKSRYLNGSISSQMGNDRLSLNSMFQLNSYQEYLLNHWNNLSSSYCLNSPDAIQALSDLSPGGCLVKSSQSTVLKEIVAIDIQKELKQLYFAGNELLRHFWACFPITHNKLEEKLNRMKETLERFQYTKLQSFREKYSIDQYSLELSNHMMNQIQTALNRYNTWQIKKNILAKK